MSPESWALGPLALALAAGVLAALVYLVALRAAELYLPRARGRGPKASARGALRLAVLFAVCWWAFGGQWDQVAACVLAFAAVRIFATRWPAFRFGMASDPALQPVNRPD